MSQNLENQQRQWLREWLRTATAGWVLFNLSIPFLGLGVLSAASKSSTAFVVYIIVAFCFAFAGGIWILLHPHKTNDDQ